MNSMSENGGTDLYLEGMIAECDLMTNKQTPFHDEKFLYEILKNRDRRFDGRFFVGVTSTGIYCRAVCPARRPKREHCRFFESAAAAESAGFRPCLRCRPELAPEESSPGERLSDLAASALRHMEAGEGGIDAVASSLGVSGRHLRRAFAARYGVSPVQYVQTSRLLFARQLILETSLSFTQIAAAAGFGSPRRMNALFRERYRCNPTELRRGTPADGAGSVVLRVPYHPPYAWRAMLDFLAPRTIEGAEEVRLEEAPAEEGRAGKNRIQTGPGGIYRRAVSVMSGDSSCDGWFSVSNDENASALRVEASISLVPVLGRVVARIKRLFDTACRPEEVEGTLGAMTEICPGLRVPGSFDSLEMAARAVLGQQITVQAARTLARRLTEALGESVETPFPGLRRVFPTPRKILLAGDGALGGLGIVRTRQRAILALAELALSGGLEPRADIGEQIRGLKELPGVGDWTAQYIAMRALSWPDAFPHTDYAVKAAMKDMATTPGEILARAEEWRPWRAYAAMFLWRRHGEETRKKEGGYGSRPPSSSPPRWSGS
jgi:AraC family transcriptional regulator of adaptative response / DNA-3-methyladenine glycosylase II